MSRIVVCMDCPNYAKGGFCTHKRKDTGALLPACDYALTLNNDFNPEDNDEAPKLSKAKAPAKGGLKPPTKLCKRCGRELPLICFGKNAGTKDGLQYRCKECQLRSVTESQARKRSAEDSFLRKSKPEPVQNNFKLSTT